jgi:hypothetical protein
VGWLKTVPTTPFSMGREVGQKRIETIKRPHQPTGVSNMMATILNAIYREFLKSSVCGMRRHHLAG